MNFHTVTRFLNKGLNQRLFLVHNSNCCVMLSGVHCQGVLTNRPHSQGLSTHRPRLPSKDLLTHQHRHLSKDRQIIHRHLSKDCQIIHRHLSKDCQIIHRHLSEGYQASHNHPSVSQQASRRRMSTEAFDVVRTQSSRGAIFGEEILHGLSAKGDTVILDMTFGYGGHSQMILESDVNVKVIAIDRDPRTKPRALEIKMMFPKRFCFFNVTFDKVTDTLAAVGVPKNSISGAVLDAGYSLAQHAELQTGFRETDTTQLDLRMDGPESAAPSALHILQHIDEHALYRVLRTYGQCAQARVLARALTQARYEMVDVRTPVQLSDFISRILGYNTVKSVTDGGDFSWRENNIHSSAMGVFQALRILVNDEINQLDCGIMCVHQLLRKYAPFAAITYNLFEHAIVKRHFAGLDVDASPDTIGVPMHRLVKSVGLADEEHSKPWTAVAKHMMPSVWKDPELRYEWRKANLRIAKRNPKVAYL